MRSTYELTFSNILVNIEPKFDQNFDQNWLRFGRTVRPNSSAEPSVEMAEPFGFGRTTFLADRSYTTNKFISFKFFLLNIKLPILESGDILPLFLM